MDWVRQNWHVPLGVALAFGLIGLCVTFYVCLPLGFFAGAFKVLQLAETTPTPYVFLGATARPVPTHTRVPSPPATPMPLAVGESVLWGDGIKVVITGYDVTDTCPGGYGEPAEGAKLIVIHVHAENVNQEIALDKPFLTFALLRNGTEVGRDAGGIVCRFDQSAWGNACDFLIYPNVSCEGWEVFEVPEALNPEETTLRVGSRDFGAVHWRLRP